MQPTPYNRTVRFNDEEASQVSGRSTVRTSALDVELDNAEVTLDGILANIAMIQRDDGQLKDSSVKTSTLSTEVLALFVATGVPRGLWLTAIAYIIKDLVQQGTNSYICASVHTSGVFATDLAAGRWVLFSTISVDASGVTFAPTVDISATNVYAAIIELNSEFRNAVNLSLYRSQGGF